jgi:hypothetical protein
MSLRCLSHRPKAKKCETQFSLFFFPKFFLILFGILDFKKMLKMKNQICYGKGKNKMTDFWRGRKSKKCKWWKKGRKIKFEITTSLISR